MEKFDLAFPLCMILSFIMIYSWSACTYIVHFLAYLKSLKILKMLKDERTQKLYKYRYFTRWTFFRSQAWSERVLENTLSLRWPLNLGTFVTCYLYYLASLAPLAFGNSSTFWPFDILTFCTHGSNPPPSSSWLVVDLGKNIKSETVIFNSETSL